MVNWVHTYEKHKDHAYGDLRPQFSTLILQMEGLYFLVPFTKIYTNCWKQNKNKNRRIVAGGSKKF
jgi:hypothetical protein